ncbi:WD40 repeat-like protein [Laetiporus sulphureus 93-53]|uniref:WD40 repeat-like protein n=1 Tax=Laetiporus sulphureus 93-53 TaxID=1314785 RepID=A0A165CBC6_9APHY|nr:WD40 repeat-like protein [Laetiporus sulphureus 93-53]KZT02500.1 WD40 repeat-like protein [Laetiporus sulphureus 93-53]
MGMPPPIKITAEEVNLLIYAYFQDSGFQHSAFVLHAESKLESSSYFGRHIPRGELVELLSKALLYTEVEAHWKGNTMAANCQKPFSLLERHVCSQDPVLTDTAPVDQAAPTTVAINGDSHSQRPTTNGINSTTEPVAKRKASTPIAGNTPTEKRARTSPPTDDNMEVDSNASSSAESKQVDARVSSGPSGSGELKKQPKAKRPPGPADDLTDPSVVSLLKGHKTEVFVCAWNPTKKSTLASGSRDTVVHLWNVPESRSEGSPIPPKIGPPMTLAYPSKSEQGDLTSLDWTRDGSLLAIGSYDAILRVCTASGELYFSHTQHEGPIFATRFSKSGRWLLTASLDGTACVWDVAQKRLHQQYQCHKDCCLDVDWLTDDIFASCGADGKIQIMSLEHSRPPKTLLGHTTEVNQIKCSPSRTKIASCSDDRTARVWNIEDVVFDRPPNDEVIVLKGHTNTVSGIAWCPMTAEGEHELLATSSFDGTSRLWDSVTGQCLRVFQDHKRHVYALAFSPDARFFATGGGDGWLHVYDVKAKQKRWSWYAGSEKPGIFEIDWQQSGNINRMALALESNQVGVVDVTRVPLLQ